MKRCPTCQRTYPDDAPGFCSADGTRLVGDESAEYDPQKTMISANPATPTPPPQQYSSPAPPENPPQQYNPPPPQPAPPQQPAWSAPQPQQPQAQNYGGGFYPPQGQPPAWPPPYTPHDAKGKGLGLAAFITGVVSGILGGLLFASFQGAFRMTRDTAYPLLLAAIILGAASLVLGVITLISSRQGGKAMAAVGMVLGAFSLGFWIYLETQYGVFFR